MLLGVSVWIRLQAERVAGLPADEGGGQGARRRRSPSRFGQWSEPARSCSSRCSALTAGQAVVWYTGQFYALFFLTQTLKVDAADGQPADRRRAAASATPFFIVFGALSDRIGRKPIIMAGCLLAALTYFPIFKALTHYANPALEAAQATAPVDGRRRSRATARSSSTRSARRKFTTLLRHRQERPGSQARRAVRRTRRRRRARVAQVKVGDGVIHVVRRPTACRPTAKTQGARSTRRSAPRSRPPAIRPRPTRRDEQRRWSIVLLSILVLYVTMVYGPIAAMLVELFPTRIRYTSMSLPYHIGNGWFGGFLPTTAFAIVAATGNIYYGLWYPIVVARDDGRHRHAVRARDEGRGHLPRRLVRITSEPPAPPGAGGFSIRHPDSVPPPSGGRPLPPKRMEPEMKKLYRRRRRRPRHRLERARVGRHRDRWRRRDEPDRRSVRHDDRRPRGPRRRDSARREGREPVGPEPRCDAVEPPPGPHPGGGFLLRERRTPQAVRNEGPPHEGPASRARTTVTVQGASAATFVETVPSRRKNWSGSGAASDATRDETVPSIPRNATSRGGAPMTM